MPKLVDYPGRFDCIREAVYLIVLRDGAESISLPSVAEQLYMSVSSVRRLLSSAIYLPELGLQWVERRSLVRRSKFFQREYGEDQPRAGAMNYLLHELPSTEEQRDDAIAWRRLTLGFPNAAWSLSAVNNRQLFLASLADKAVPEELAPADRDHEAGRLVALVLGATEAVCEGMMRPEESRALLRRHFDDLAPAWLDLTPRGAA